MPVSEPTVGSPNVTPVNTATYGPAGRRPPRNTNRSEEEGPVDISKEYPGTPVTLMVGVPPHAAKLFTKKFVFKNKYL